MMMVMATTMTIDTTTCPLTLAQVPPQALFRKGERTMIETLEVELLSLSFVARGSSIAPDTQCALSPAQWHLNHRLPRSLTQRARGGVRVRCLARKAELGEQDCTANDLGLTRLTSGRSESLMR